MYLRTLNEAGYEQALLGLSLSFKDRAIPLDSHWTDEKRKKTERVAQSLCGRGGGHDKFLESMQVWLYVEAPRFWWSEFDTYRVGMTKQSESTMHTLSKRPATLDDFDKYVHPNAIKNLNELIAQGASIGAIKANLPDGYLQARVISTNYKVLHNIITQRYRHRLHHWERFVDELYEQVEHPELLPSVEAMPHE